MRNWNTYKQILFLLVFTLSAHCIAQIYNTEVEAKILIATESGRKIIKASALNKTPLNHSLRYELFVIKGAKNSMNKSRNTQKGRFVLPPSEQKQLATTTINVTSNDRLIVLLLIYNAEDVLLGKDQIVFHREENLDSDKVILRKTNEKA
ncbi:hypothetical protein G5B37_13465 [Rasiella rasia]|uniref:Uncharacterized protein n=1 Tax=Rasiella rasia TaxID=2744027 RepID=A0A6G6GPK9_9FLAO|nr:hypothetical protein [Rasiella rasia]QIE60535.1 hypothetical protein G5B37_13465 [Rasiella rasia]